MTGDMRDPGHGASRIRQRPVGQRLSSARRLRGGTAFPLSRLLQTSLSLSILCVLSLSLSPHALLPRLVAPNEACTLRSPARARSLACRVRFLLFCFASCRRPQSAFLGEPQASALRMGLGSHQAMRAVSVSRPSRPVASVNAKVDGELAKSAAASLPYDHTPARVPALRRSRPRPRPMLSCCRC